MTDLQASVVYNRMQTLVGLYNRGTTIDELANKLKLTYGQVQKVLSAHNYWHGIKREPSPEHPVNPMIFFKDYEYLLECDILDTMRQ